MGAFPYEIWFFFGYGVFHRILSNWIPSCVYMNLDPYFMVHWSLLSVLFCSLVSLVSLVLLWVHFHIKIWFFFLWKWGFPYSIPSTFIKLNPFMCVYEFGCFFHSALTITICTLCPLVPLGSLVPLWVNFHIKI